MIVDASAIVAILLEEPEGHRLIEAIFDAAPASMSSASQLEVSMVLLSRKGESALEKLDALLLRLQVQIVPFTELQARLAREAFRRYGKGRHPAGLNFGDCISYALARETAEELLFKGTDFSQTDVLVAQY
ncbi:type II toxin-antitoxin system VapC family toxin [Telmatobacter bradus]|uniref:type II toxin-antitoxin system VapC family toxin n=1 Tax=Telmatobacter bradus TaxID=474953 RepID=UPI003B43AE47